MTMILALMVDSGWDGGGVVVVVVVVVMVGGRLITFALLYRI